MCTQFMHHNAKRNIVWIVEEKLIPLVRAKASLVAAKFDWTLSPQEGSSSEHVELLEDSRKTLLITCPATYAKMIRDGSPFHRQAFLIIETISSLLDEKSVDYDDMNFILRRYSLESAITRPKVALFAPKSESEISYVPSRLQSQLNPIIPNLSIASISSSEMDRVIKELSHPIRRYLLETPKFPNSVEILQRNIASAIYPLLTLYTLESEQDSKRGLYRMEPRKDGIPISEFEYRSRYLDPLLPYHTREIPLFYDSGLINLDFLMKYDRISRSWDKCSTKLILDAIDALCNALLLIIDTGPRIAIEKLLKRFSKIIASTGKRSSKNTVLDKISNIVSSVIENISNFKKMHSISDKDSPFEDLEAHIEDNDAQESEENVKRLYGRSGILIKLIEKEYAKERENRYTRDTTDSKTAKEDGKNENNSNSPNSPSIEPEDASKALESSQTASKEGFKWKPRFVVHVSTTTSANRISQLISTIYPDIKVGQLGEVDDEPTCEDFFSDSKATEDENDSKSKNPEIRLLLVPPSSQRLVERHMEKYLEKHPKNAPRFIEGALYGPNRSEQTFSPAPSSHSAFDESKTCDSIITLRFGSYSTHETMLLLQRGTGAETVVNPKNANFSLASQLISMSETLPEYSALITSKEDVARDCQAVLSAVRAKQLKRYEPQSSGWMGSANNSNNASNASSAPNNTTLEPSSGDTRTNASLNFYSSGMSAQSESERTSSTSPGYTTTPIPNTTSSKEIVAGVESKSLKSENSQMIQDLVKSAQSLNLNGMNGSSSMFGGDLFGLEGVRVGDKTIPAEQLGLPSAQQTSAILAHLVQSNAANPLPPANNTTRNANSSGMAPRPNTQTMQGSFFAGQKSFIEGMTEESPPLSVFEPNSEFSARLRDPAPPQSSLKLMEYQKSMQQANQMQPPTTSPSIASTHLGPEVPRSSSLSLNGNSSFGSSNGGLGGTNTYIAEFRAQGHPMPLFPRNTAPEGLASLNPQLDEVLVPPGSGNFGPKIPPSSSALPSLSIVPQDIAYAQGPRIRDFESHFNPEHGARSSVGTPQNSLQNTPGFAHPQQRGSGANLHEMANKPSSHVWPHYSYPGMVVEGKNSTSLINHHEETHLPYGATSSSAASGEFGSLDTSHNFIARDNAASARSEANSDPVSMLQIYLSRLGVAGPVYEEIDTPVTSDGTRIYTITCKLINGETFEGSGARKKDAKKNAAAQALEYAAREKNSLSSDNRSALNNNHDINTRIPSLGMAARESPSISSVQDFGSQGSYVPHSSSVISGRTFHQQHDTGRMPVHDYLHGVDAGFGISHQNQNIGSYSTGMSLDMGHSSATSSYTSSSSSSRSYGSASLSSGGSTGGTSSSRNFPPSLSSAEQQWSQKDRMQSSIYDPPSVHAFYTGLPPSGAPARQIPTSSPTSSSNISQRPQYQSSISLSTQSPYAAGGPSTDRATDLPSVHHNPIGLVNEYHQKQARPMPTYVDKGRESGPDHEPNFVCVGTLYDGTSFEARGSSKKEAKTNAAILIARAIGLLA